MNNLYLDFDCSEIPSNATINSVTGSVRLYGSTTLQSRTVTREIQCFSGTNPKGTAVPFDMTGSATIFEIEDGGQWTRAELDDARIRIYVTRNSSNSTTNTYVYMLGADFRVDYTEGGSGGGSTPSVQTINFSYTGSMQSTSLPAGKYKLECWGAQGGSYQNYEGGLGGYSVGTITLSKQTTIYAYVGGQPETNSSSRATPSGGFNGGGNGQNRYYSSTYTYGQGGGGASDIRIGQDSLYARVIVAGGGGGSASDNSTTKYGGGQTGGHGGASSSASYVAGQTEPTTSGYYRAGTFGQGANAYTSRNNYQMGSGGGGGGWYGGYAYNYAQDSQTALRGYNGGGSGYVYTSGSANNYPSGCLLTATYYLSDAQTIGGNVSFPATDSGNETGHAGNGYIRITPIIEDTGTGISFKRSGTWIDVQKIFIKQNGSWTETDASILDANTKYVLK